MKKYIALFLTIFISCNSMGFFVYAENDEAEFDDASVIVVMKPVNTSVRLFSEDSIFDGLGISDVKNLYSYTSSEMSLFSMSGENQVIKLTLSEHSRENVLETIDKLNKMPEVELAEPNYIYRLSDIPNDEYYQQNKQYGLNKINALSVWNMDIKCKNVIVAIIDSGAMIDHPDLQSNIWTNPGETPDNNIDDDGNGFIDDVHGWNFIDNNNDLSDEVGHGTHVAGIVSASTNNGIGVASLARDAKIVPIKVFSARETKLEYIVQAINYVHKMGFDIVNNSFGGNGSDEMRRSIEQCTNSVFTAASGNSNLNIDVQPKYPASYDCDNIISVAATDSNDRLRTSSNYGVKSVDIAAPGDAIWSTSFDYSYVTKGGTSMACPMVSSAAAVVKAKYPDMTPAEIINKLESSADTISALNGKIKTGARLNAYEALLIHAQSVSLNQSSITVNKGDTLNLTANVSPSNTTDTALWQSSDTNVVTVDNDGTITAQGYGKAVITVTYGENISSSCEVTVPIAAREGNHVKISLDFLDESEKNNILIFAAIKENGILKKAFMPKAENMSAEFDIPDSMEDMDVTVYIWNKDYTSYTDAPILAERIHR